MKSPMKDFIIMSIILLSFDAVYINTTLNIFKKQIVDVQRVIMQFRMNGAIVCYIFLLIGLYWFIIRQNRSPLEAAILGAVIYGVYDSTNYATLKKWKAQFAIVDTLWGAILFGCTTAAVYALRGIV